MRRTILNTFGFLILCIVFISCNDQTEYDVVAEKSIIFRAVDNANNKIQGFYVNIYKDSTDYENGKVLKSLYVNDNVVIKLSELPDKFLCNAIGYKDSLRFISLNFFGSKLFQVQKPDDENVFQTVIQFKCSQNIKVYAYLYEFDCVQMPVLTEAWEDMDATNVDLYIKIKDEYMSELLPGIDAQPGTVIPINYLFSNFEKQIEFYDYDFNITTDDKLLGFYINPKELFKGVSDINSIPISFKNISWDNETYHFGDLKIKWIVKEL
jgi:hypothetical protein